MNGSMKTLLAVVAGFVVTCAVAQGTWAADLDEHRNRQRDLNAALNLAVEEIDARLAELAHPLSLQDAEVVEFNVWRDEKLEEVHRLYADLAPSVSGVGQALQQEGLPAIALARHQEIAAELQTRYLAAAELLDSLAEPAYDMRPRGQGVHTREETEREDEVRTRLSGKIKEIRDFVRNGRAPAPKNFQLPPWEDIKMKKREPKEKREGISPSYLKAAPPPAGEQGSTLAAASTDQAALVAPAAASVQPADTTHSVDTEPNQKILDLAASLENNPVRMYEWVLNNVAYQPYYGSAKGAVKTYYDRAGNDFDTASLLVSLFRAAGIPTRYVYGTVSLTAAQANNLFGTDSAVSAAAILANGGIPVRWDGLNLLVEHCWVEAYVPYDNYRGTVSLPGGNAWVPLDPSSKSYDYQAGRDVAKDVPMDWKSFFENGVTEQTAAEIWKEKIAAHLATAEPGATIEEVPRTRRIRQERFGALPLSLRVEVRQVHWEATEIADELRHKVQFKYFETATPDWAAPTELDVVLPLPRILSGRITLNWVPASPEDATIIERFGGLHRTPSYLVKVRPAVMLEGEVMDTGLPVAIGRSGYLREYAILPAGVQGATDDFGNLYQVVKKQVSSPSIYGLGFGFQGYAEEYVQEHLARLEANRQSQSYDDVYGEIAYINAITWYQRVYDSDSEVAALRHFVNCPSQVAMGFALLGAGVEGMMGGMGAMSVSARSLSLDMTMIWTMTPLHLEQVEEQATKIMGASDSQLEHMVLEEYYTIQAVSAVKLIQQAYVDGVPVRNGWVDPALGRHIYMDDDVEIFNYRGRGRIEGGYFISGDLSGGSFAAYIGVSIKTGARFVFPSGGPLMFRVSLNSVAPIQVVGNHSFDSVKVFQGSTELSSAITYNVVYVGTEWQGKGKERVRVGLYDFDLAVNDWSIVTPGAYTLELTLKPYYWIEDSHIGTVPFTVYPAVSQSDPIHLADGAGATLPIDYSSGRIWIPLGEQVCISGVIEFSVYTPEGRMALHSLANDCYTPPTTGRYRMVYVYLSNGQLFNGTLEVVVLKVDIKDIFPGQLTPRSLLHPLVSVTYDAVDPTGTLTAKARIFTANNSISPIHETVVNLGTNKIFQWDGNPNSPDYRISIDPYSDDYAEEELSPLLIHIGLYSSQEVSGDAQVLPVRTLAKFMTDNASNLRSIEIDCTDWAVFLWKEYCAGNSEATDIGGGHPDLTFRVNESYPDSNGNGLPDKPALMVADMWHYSWSTDNLPPAMENVPDRDEDGVPALSGPKSVDWGDIRPGDVIFIDHTQDPQHPGADHTVVVLEVYENDAKIGYGNYDRVELDGLPGKLWPDEYDFKLPIVRESFVAWFVATFTEPNQVIYAVKRFGGEQ